MDAASGLGSRVESFQRTDTAALGERLQGLRFILQTEHGLSKEDTPNREKTSAAALSTCKTNILGA